MNVARTCSTFTAMGGKCSAIDSYPNATIAEYGSISGASAMQKEIYARGPIACGIDASPILKYTSGIATDDGEGVDHVISVVGWGNDEKEGKYWIVRNSWGEYWGEMGYIRVKFGALMVEEQCAWVSLGLFSITRELLRLTRKLCRDRATRKATVKAFTTAENQVHCYEGGENCQ